MLPSLKLAVQRGAQKAAMTGQYFPIPKFKTVGWLACLVAAAFALTGCETNKKSVADQAPSVSDLTFNSSAMVRVGDRLRKGGDYMAALHMYQRVREQDPKNIPALLGEGEILLTMGAFPDAEQRFRAARSFGDDSARSAAGLGRALLRENQPREALQFFEKALKEPKASAETYNGYGVTLDLIGRHQDAQIAYSKGLDKDPGNVILTNNLALSFALSQDYAAALRMLSDLASAQPDAKSALENLSLVYGLSGDMESARKVAALDFKGDALEQRVAYIKRIAALPADVRGEAIILGIEPDVAVAADTPATPATASKQPKPGQQKQPTAAGATTGATPAPEAPAPAQAAEPAAMETTAPAAGAEPTATVADSQSKPDPLLSAEPAYLVQLGSYLDQRHARRGWSRLKKRAPDVLGSLEPAFESITLDGHDVVRLGIRVTDGYAAADARCKAFKAAGVDCLVRRAAPASAAGSENGGSSAP